MNRGIASIELNKLQAALADYNRALLIEPDNLDFYNNRAWLFIKLDYYNRALEDFKKAGQLYIENDDMQGYQRMMKQINKANKLIME